MSAISLPTPRDEAYWDREALLAEEKRVFEICNGCRLCFNLCPSFPALFDGVDALDTSEDAAPQGGSGIELDEHGNHDFTAHGNHVAETRADVTGQVDALERLPLSVNQEVVDLCYQCKLCDPICPYTPPHEFAVDFPRLMLRHRAIDARENGVKFQDRVLGNPDLIGRLGTLMPAIANAVTNLPINRTLMQATVGIHKDRQLPAFADETFLEWFGRTHTDQPSPEEVDGPKVLLFYTCSVQWNEPQVGRKAVEVLEHNGYTVFAPPMKCCGMPALDGGDVPTATSWAEHNVDIIHRFVKAGCDVVAPGPTCSFMMKHEWAEYIGSEAAEEVAAASYDLMEYLYKLGKERRLHKDFSVEQGTVAYHVPCHLKVQKIGFRSRDIMKRLPGTQVKLLDKCSCMDGTWGMKTEYYELSKKWAEPLLTGLVADEPDQVASDCLIAKLQIEENTGRKVLHPIEVVWQSYGGTDESPLPPRAAAGSEPKA